MKEKFEELFFDNKERYAIVIAFFDWMIRSDFRGILNTLAQDISYGSETIGCLHFLIVRRGILLMELNFI